MGSIGRIKNKVKKASDGGPGEIIPIHARVSEEFKGMAFEGMCPYCMQPFVMDYMRELENTLVVCKQAIESLEVIQSNNNHTIAGLRAELHELKAGRRIILPGRRPFLS